MKRFVLILSLFLILLSSSVIAAPYADIEIEAFADGTLEIDGTTNYVSFQEFEVTDYLNKVGNYWVLNITTDEVFSDAVYKIVLPEDVVVNYIRVPDLLTIDNKKGHMTVLGVAHEQKFNILVQYSADKKSSLWWLILFVVALIIGFGTWKYLMKSPVKQTIKYKGLSPRQQQILDIILKNPNGITQAKLEEITKLPKSSLSRNVDALVRKEIIQKEQSGMTNTLFVKK